MCSPALVILRGSNSALVAALVIQDLALIKTYENYEILWTVRKDCYAYKQIVSLLGGGGEVVLFFFLRLFWSSTKWSSNDMFLLQWYGQDSPDISFPLSTCLLQQMNKISLKFIMLRKIFSDLWRMQLWRVVNSTLSASKVLRFKQAGLTTDLFSYFC